MLPVTNADGLLFPVEGLGESAEAFGNIKGKAMFIWWSAGPTDDKPDGGSWQIRWSRFFQPIHQ